MKVQLDIPENKLYFLNVPPEYKNFRIDDYGFAGSWLTEKDSDGNNPWRVYLPSNRYEILGFVKDVIVGEINTEFNFVLRIL